MDWKEAMEEAAVGQDFEATKEGDMASMKKRARDTETGKFYCNLKAGKGRAASKTEVTALESTNLGANAEPLGQKDKGEGVQHQQMPPAKRVVGRLRIWPPKETKLFELSITVFVGGADVDAGLMDSLTSFLSKETLAGKCSLERGSTVYHACRTTGWQILAKSKGNQGWETKGKPLADAVASRMECAC